MENPLSATIGSIAALIAAVPLSTGTSVMKTDASSV